MSARTLHPEAAAYAAAVREALGDLPETEREDVCEELESYLSDVLVELGPDAPAGMLEVRLGSPQMYADELRTAAGYPLAGSVARRRRRDLRFVSLVFAAARSRWTDLVRRIEGHRGGAEAVRLLRELRPAWWVLRAWLAVLSLDYVYGGEPHGFPFPRIGGSEWLLGAGLFVGSVALSVWLGRQGLRGGGWPRAVGIGVNVAMIPAALTVTAQIQSGVSGQGYVSYDTPVYEQGPLVSDNGWIRDVYPFDADGTPLTDVYLFDQDGNPIRLSTGPDCWIDGWLQDGQAFPQGTPVVDPLTGACEVGPTTPPFAAVIPRTDSQTAETLQTPDQSEALTAPN